jgi:hypothetical protein
MSTLTRIPTRLLYGISQLIRIRLYERRSNFLAGLAEIEARTGKPEEVITLPCDHLNHLVVVSNSPLPSI